MKAQRPTPLPRVCEDETPPTEALATFIVPVPRLKGADVIGEYLACDFADLIDAAHDLAESGAYLPPLLLFDLANIARTLADALATGRPIRGRFAGSAAEAASALARSLAELHERLGATPDGDCLSYAAVEGPPGELGPGTLEALGAALQAASRAAAREARGHQAAGMRERERFWRGRRADG